MNNPKIAFCTTCKNRTPHLKQTLPKNIADNSDYDNCIFVVVNYNTQDDMMEYLNREHSRDIKSGKLIVYSALDVDKFKMAHAKNLSHRLGILEGADILVNVDADNFTEFGFATYIANQYKEHGNNLYMWSKMVKGEMPRGISGRIVVHKHAFINVGGYDEKYESWDRDDKDFNERLGRIGYKSIEVDPKFLNGVRHNDKLRFKEYPEAALKTFDYIDDNIENKNTIVNYGKIGCALVQKNFEKKVIKIESIPTRIFGIGMHKTGTTSLNSAMKTLGFDSAHWQNAHWAKRIWNEMQEFGYSHTLEKHYTLSDLPITLLYEKLDKAYPNSKFILTIRDECSWIKSVENHWNPELNQYRHQWNKDPFTHKVHKLLYGQKGYNRELFLERYRRHNKEVLEYFKDRPNDLLVLKIDENTGWNKLCKFLNVLKPKKKKFPKMNVSVHDCNTKFDKIRKKIIRMWCIMNGMFISFYQRFANLLAYLN